MKTTFDNKTVGTNSLRFLLIVVGLPFLLLFSCDKVEHPYLPQYVDIDTALLSGMTLEQYKSSKWPNFTQNANTNRNVLIEDFTGHKCVNCPNAGVEARTIEEANHNRVFVASIHAGPNGSTSFQTTGGIYFTNDFTNSDGLKISTELTDGGFIGNPSGTVSRRNFGGQIFQGYTSWANYTSGILSENDLKVNLQAASNYFEESRGYFLHTETELINTSSDDLYQVVYLIEDSLIAPQLVPTNWPDQTSSGLNVNYIHRDIHRACLDGFSMGRKLTAANKKDKDGHDLPGNKYYLNYSYQLPESYNPKNMHVLVFVYDKSNMEVLQVIRERVSE